MATMKPGKLSDLTPDNHNANRGTQRGGAMVESSLRKYGAGRSILTDKHGKIIAGNNVTQGATNIGLCKTVVVKTRGDEIVVVQREDLDLDKDKAAKELAIADNRAAEVGLEWDPEALAQLQVDGADLSEMFSQDELDALTETLSACGEEPEDPDDSGPVTITLEVDRGKFSKAAEREIYAYADRRKMTITIKK